jgi:hypothetical protein
LNSLDPAYLYTFETTAADLTVGGPNDTLIVLFNSQTLPMVAGNQVDINDDQGVIRLSKLSDKDVLGNWCFVVTSLNLQATGTFTLKITRNLPVVYETTSVTNASFTNNEASFDETIVGTSPFDVQINGATNRYGRYFNLNSLSGDYNYTFETTAANLSGADPDNTVIVLFNSQTQPMVAGNQVDLDNNTGVEDLSKLTNLTISGNWCLVVTSNDEEITGTFTLKITRNLQVAYEIESVTNASFTNNEVTFDKTLVDTSPFDVQINGATNRYGWYFNLNSLSGVYNYTFETTAASLSGTDPDDTYIALFNNQTHPMVAGNQVDLDNNTGVGDLSKLSNTNISGNWCLVVTSYPEQVTGTFTLKITRNLQVAYEIESVTDGSFTNNEVIYSNKHVRSSSPYNVRHFAVEDRYGTYFNLNNLDPAYNYTFETTAADFGYGYFQRDTFIALFNSQTQPMNLGNLLTTDDQGGAAESNLSKLSNLQISGNWCLVVTGRYARLTGTIVLKITRELNPGGGPN